MPNFGQSPPVKIKRGWQNVWVVISSSAKELAVYILLARDRCADWGI